MGRAAPVHRSFLFFKLPDKFPGTIDLIDSAGANTRKHILKLIDLCLNPAQTFTQTIMKIGWSSLPDGKLKILPDGLCHPAPILHQQTQRLTEGRKVATLVVIVIEDVIPPGYLLTERYSRFDEPHHIHPATNRLGCIRFARLLIPASNIQVSFTGH